MIFLIAIISSFLVTFILLPVIIKVSTSIDLLDIPDRRKLHYVGTPSLGGVAIFFGMMMAIVITIPIAELATLKYLLTGICMIFVLGIRDDVSSLKAIHKLAIQVFAAIMVVYFSDVSLNGLYGIGGIHELPYGIDAVLSVFVIVAMTNSFNLIDGIDGLAGSLGIIILLFFSWIFLASGQVALALIPISAIGALFAFLYFNWNPSKVFMGDTGSMILGFIISCLSISAINSVEGLTLWSDLKISSSVGLVVSALIVPVYDTSRVFTIRFSKGRSPLSPDRNHIHHVLLNLNLNHGQATILLASMNLVIVGFALFVSPYWTNAMIILFSFGTMMVFGAVMDFLVARRKYQQKFISLNSKKELTVNKSA